jgi:hypothetical protein
MKRITNLLGLLLLALPLWSQTYNGTGNKGNDYFGAGDGNGAIVESSGRFQIFKVFKENEKYGIRKRDSVMIPAVYDTITNLGSGFLLKKNDLYGVANSLGKQVIPVQYQKITYNPKFGYTYQVMNNNRYGSIDLSGNIILPVNYFNIHYSSPYSGASVVEDVDGALYLVFKNLAVYKKPLQNIMIFKDGVIASINGKYGLLKDGKEVLPFEYESIADQNKVNIQQFKNVKGDVDFSVNFGNNSCFLMSKNQKFGLLNTSGAVILNTEYDNIKYDNLRHIYLLTLNNLQGIYFESSKKLINCEYQSVYTDGTQFITLKKDNKYGIVNYQAEVILPYEFDEISIRGWNSFFRVKKSGKYGYFKSSGELIIPTQYDNLEGFYNSKFDHLLKATLHDSVGVINLKNEIVVPIRYKFVNDLNNYFQVELNGKRGLYSLKGEEICKPEFDRIYTSHSEKSNILFTRSNNLYGIIGDGGKLLFEPQFVKIGYIHDEDLLVNPISNYLNIYQFVKHKNGKYGVFEERHSNLVIPIEYDSVCQRFDFGESTFFILKKGDKYGVVNNNNEPVISFKYDYLSFNNVREYYLDEKTNIPVVPNEVLVVAKKNSKYGVIDLKEKIHVPFKYSYIERVSYQPLFKASKHNTYQFINNKNEVLNAGPFDEIAKFEEFSTLTFYKGQMRVMDINGKFTTAPVSMNPHKGFESFEALKQALIMALNDTSDASLKVFADKIAPSDHLLFYLKENLFTDEPLYTLNIQEIKEIYYLRLLAFKHNDWNSEFYRKESLTKVDDYTMYKKNIVTNFRFEDHAFGDTRFMEKVLRNAIKINGYWISTYFLTRNFYSY